MPSDQLEAGSLISKVITDRIIARFLAKAERARSPYQGSGTNSGILRARSPQIAHFSGTWAEGHVRRKELGSGASSGRGRPHAP